jgi:copper chaperone
MITTLHISGMTCGHCEMTVRKALTTVPGVTRVVEVSKDRGEAVVDGSASAEAMISAVAKEGYEARIAG